ncbi:MAG: DUF3048 C-terminal domain-containing protein [Clostridia bacterium]|nr:DUF3048 C-terminal domain-containing protein [Clostridia bacterium]
MNKKKTGNLLRLIAFFLTSIILVCTFGFTVDGWITNGNENIVESSKNDTEESNNPDMPDNEVVDSTPQKPEIYIPKHVNSLTGLECTEEIAENVPLCFLLDTKEANYGICGSDILIEIPIENEETRLLCIRRDIDNLLKIGSLSKTRGYISSVSSFFGAINVCVGNDDTLNYPYCTNGKVLDLSLVNGYHYTEFSNYSYTNTDLINKAFEDFSLDVNNSSPFLFNDYKNEPITYDKKGERILIPYSSDNQKSLIFNTDERVYYLYNNGIKISDALNGKSPFFTNCLILFADSTTYDKQSGSTMIMDTIGCGSGYYFTNGTFTQITWESTAEGVISFYDTNGEKLIINRGSTYVSYFKSSLIDKIVYS